MQGDSFLTASPFTYELRPLKSPSNTEHKCKRSSSSELSIGCIIAHLPPSSSAPSPSLPVCPSPPSAPFYAQNKSERTHGWRRKQGETIDNSLGHHGIWIFTVGNMRAGLWDTGEASVNASDSFTRRKFPQVLMLPTEISGGVCFTSR